MKKFFLLTVFNACMATFLSAGPGDNDHKKEARKANTSASSCVPVMPDRASDAVASATKDDKEKIAAPAETTAGYKGGRVSDKAPENGYPFPIGMHSTSQYHQLAMVERCLECFEDGQPPQKKPFRTFYVEQKNETFWTGPLSNVLFDQYSQQTIFPLEELSQPDFEKLVIFIKDFIQTPEQQGLLKQNYGEREYKLCLQSVSQILNLFRCKAPPSEGAYFQALQQEDFESFLSTFNRSMFQYATDEEFVLKYGQNFRNINHFFHQACAYALTLGESATSTEFGMMAGGESKESLEMVRRFRFVTQNFCQELIRRDMLNCHQDYGFIKKFSHPEWKLFFQKDTLGYELLALPLVEDKLHILESTFIDPGFRYQKEFLFGPNCKLIKDQGVILQFLPHKGGGYGRVRSFFYAGAAGCPERELPLPPFSVPWGRLYSDIQTEEEATELDKIMHDDFLSQGCPQRGTLMFLLTEPYVESEVESLSLDYACLFYLQMAARGIGEEDLELQEQAQLCLAWIEAESGQSVQDTLADLQGELKHQANEEYARRMHQEQEKRSSKVQQEGIQGRLRKPASKKKKNRHTGAKTPSGASASATAHKTETSGLDADKEQRVKAILKEFKDKGRVKFHTFQSSLKRLMKVLGPQNWKQSTKGSHMNFHMDGTPGITVTKTHGKGKDNTMPAGRARQLLRHFVQSLGKSKLLAEK
jgi:hypothetical protein